MPSYIIEVVQSDGSNKMYYSIKHLAKFLKLTTSYLKSNFDAYRLHGEIIQVKDLLFSSIVSRKYNERHFKPTSYICDEDCIRYLTKKYNLMNDDYEYLSDVSVEEEYGDFLYVEDFIENSFLNDKSYYTLSYEKENKSPNIILKPIPNISDFDRVEEM
ncbi:hypothetical protein PV326_003170 [Microctonus aethiopoides]|nr:hypothetical protein PV326_003170 [Microctonus aethiopoides]